MIDVVIAYVCLVQEVEAVVLNLATKTNELAAGNALFAQIVVVSPGSWQTLVW